MTAVLVYLRVTAGGRVRFRGVQAVRCVLRVLRVNFKWQS